MEYIIKLSIEKVEPKKTVPDHFAQLEKLRKDMHVFIEGIFAYEVYLKSIESLNWCIHDINMMSARMGRYTYNPPVFPKKREKFLKDFKSKSPQK